MSEKKKKKGFSKKAFKKSLRIYSYLRPYRVQFGIGLFFLLLNSLGNIALPKFLGVLVDFGNESKPQAEINKVMLLLSGMLLIQAFAGFMRTNLFVRVTSKTLAAIRQSVYAHLIKLPMGFFLKRRVGELNSRITSDITILEETLTSTIASFLRNTITIIGALIFMFFISPQLTLFMLAIVPVIVLIAKYFGKFIRSLSKKMQAQIAESNTIVEETLQGVQNVKAYANEYFEIERYTKKTNEVAKTGIVGGLYRGGFSAFMTLGMTGAMASVIWRGTILIGQNKMAAGELFSFVLYTVFIAGMISGLAEVYAQLQKAIGATENLFEILDERSEEILPQQEIAPENVLNGNISFNNITFHYPTRTDIDVLKNLSLNIDSNKLIALVGPSGAGKSTIVNILLRYYELKEGQLLLNGKESKDIPLTELRSQIAVVPQDVFLFGGTIRENIAYGKLGASEEEIIEAAKQANAWTFIQSFPEGLDCIVGERGIQLSGGQRQRLAIARAVLKNPRILVLDEATSSLDSESERLVQEALEKLMKGRTSIVIAHRLATIRKADQIIVLDNGQIIQQGTHEELIDDTSGLYSALSELQFAG
ncbi:MAG: ABC transporter transmembrane domain-containing protein [Prolixibacteraceae bacterium]|jgi:ABC-type multidrug transport system fused ATPase/permease subunit|nr:ABC transporter transmembrane domain-containing protein [Prolixibacteraceae bacterium]